MYKKDNNALRTTAMIATKTILAIRIGRSETLTAVPATTTNALMVVRI